MSTWKVGDSWITFSGLTVGTGGMKLAAQEDALKRKAAKKPKKVIKTCGDSR